MALTKRRLDIELDPKEIDEFRSINVKMDNAERTLKIPDGSEALYAAGIKNREAVQFELADWWNKIQKKYNVPGTARVDLVKECLFEAVDENGVPSDADNIDPNKLEWSK